jgi:hypothetical protein
VSVVRGVGQAVSFSRTDMGRFGDFLFPCDVPRAFESDAVGEGHPAISRGENEDPLALVRGADFSRAEYSPRHRVTHFFQVADDCGESQRDVSLDVFEEAQGWFTKSNTICDPGPEVPFVVFPFSLSCCGDGLARVAPSEDVHQSVKLSEWEALEIRPKRSWVQESRFHFRDQVRDGEGFDLTNSDCAQASDSSAESEINSTVPGAQADMICFGSIHISSSWIRASY